MIDLEECTPKVCEAHRDEDDELIKTFNCEQCNNKECEYWKDYNE